jgi:hypothetical protein
MGVVVQYRQSGRLKEQLFKQQAFVCAVAALTPDVVCPGHTSGFADMGDFDADLKARRHKS